MKDPEFKALIKHLEDQFGRLTMEELGIVWAAYAYLKDDENKIKVLKEEVVVRTKKL